MSFNMPCSDSYETLLLINQAWPFVLLLLTCLYLACQAIYNLYFHPLAKHPGPKLAAATGFYEFYYDVVKGGRFPEEVQRMHAVYGTYPIL